MNTTSLLGRLTKEPDIRSNEKGLHIASFTLAVQRDYKNENGDYETDFINCKAFRTTADFIEKYVKKGNLILVSGEIRTGSYEKDGERKYTFEVIVEKVKNLTPKEKVENEPSTNEFSEFNPNTITVTDDDLPF